MIVSKYASARERHRQLERERKRRERDLARKGLKGYRVTVPEFPTVNGLIASRALTEEQSRDNDMVEEALSKLIIAFGKDWADY